MPGKVEDWRANFRVRWLVRRFCSGPQSGSLGRVSSLRSSNRACGFPAHGSRTRSCLRARKAHGPPRQVNEAVVASQPLRRKTHEFPELHLMLLTEPLAEPPSRVLIDRAVGWADVSEAEVVCPSGDGPVEVSHNDL